MARYNLQIKTGTYVGNGVDDTGITGVGFRPDLVIIDSDSTTHSVMRTKHMIGDSTSYLNSATANLANAVQSLDADGFTVGTDGTVNSNAVNYYYTAIRGTSGQDYFKTGRYVGTGGDDRNYTGGLIGFTPDLVIAKRDAGTSAYWRSSAMPADSSGTFAGIAQTADVIQSLISGGFQLGTNAGANGSGSTYYFMAMKALAGVIAVGTYTGNGVAGKKVSGVGFQPDMVITHRDSASNQGIYRTSSMPDANSSQMGASASNNQLITAMHSDGFTLGNNAGANGSGSTYYWFAFKSGNYNVPLNRLSA
jgi:hypothetical protein